MIVQHNWYRLYNIGTLSTDFALLDGHFDKFTTASLNLPKMITNMWVTRQIGEKPIIKLNDEHQEVPIDFKDMITKLYAYGKVIVVPYVNSFNEFHYVALTNLTQIDYTVLDGRLVRLLFKVESMSEYFLYQLDPEFGLRQQRGTVDNSGVFQAITDWEPSLLQPFYLELNINAYKYPIPIWGNAVHLIEDANQTHHEMMLAMNLLRPIVSVPPTLEVNSYRKDEEVKPAILHKNMRLFSYNPALSDDYNKLDYFGGTFNPEPYTKAMNYILSQIGILCGLGREALVFDPNTNSAARNPRTATEVLMSQNDIYINQNFLSEVTKDAIFKLVKEYYTFININTDELEVIIQDNILDDEAKFMNMLFEDYQLGVISKEFYLSKRYPDYKPEDIMSKNVVDNSTSNVDNSLDDSNMMTISEDGQSISQGHTSDPINEGI